MHPCLRHEEYSPCPKTSLCPDCISLVPLQTLATTDLFTVFIRLPFQIVGGHDIQHTLFSHWLTSVINLYLVMFLHAFFFFLVAYIDHFFLILSNISLMDYFPVVYSSIHQQNDIFIAFNFRLL